MWANISRLLPPDFNVSPSDEPPHDHELIRAIRPVPGTSELYPPVNPNETGRSGSPETLNQWRHTSPAGRSSAFVDFANSKKNEDNDKAVKVYKRRGGCCWDSKELEQPATFEELGMDPENNNGIISDLLTFVMEKESHKKVGKAWTRCYVLYEPPGTDRSSLIGAIANYLKFDIYNVDLMSLSSISELKKVLGSTQNHSLIAIQDYNLWLRFPQPKNQLTVPGLLKIIDNLFSRRGDEHIIVFTTNHRDRHDAAPVDTDMHIYTSSPRPSALSSEFVDTNHGAHLVRQDQGRCTASHSDKKRTRRTSNSEGKTPRISLENLQQNFGRTRKQAADNLKVSVSTLKRACREHKIKPWPNRKRNKVFRPRDQHGERNTSTLWETPSHNVQPGMDGEPVGQNQEANVFRRDFMEGPIAMNTEGGLIMVLRPPDQYEERNTSTACEAPPHNVQTGIEGESVGHSPVCFTVQTLSPRPSARRTPAPAAEPSIPHEDRQQEENEASFVGTTSITDSDLSRLCEREIIVQTDDILGGQGSAALGDYTIDFGMGEQNREVETREGPIAMNTEGGLIMVLRPPDQYEERNTSTACEAPPHNVQTRIEVWRPPNQLEGQTTQFTAPPNPNALVFPQFQIASTQVLSKNEDRRNSLASQVEAFLMGHVSESSNLAFPAYSDTAAPSQPVATILQTMPMTTHMIPQTGGFSGIFQLEGQLTQSTSHPNPNVVVPQEPQIASTQMLSENMGSLENWEEFLSLEEETSLGGHVSRSVNLTVTTCCDPSLRQQPMPTNRDMMPTTHVMSHLVAREDERSVTVKISYRDRTIKLFQVPLTTRIIEVKEEVKKRLKLEPSNFDFEYKDEDGDWIFLGCDEDLTNHLQLFSNRVIRLLVVDSDASTKNICESCGSLKRKRQ